MDKIKLGFVPTRRSFFSAPDAIKYRGLTADRLREIGIDIVDIDDINDEGLLFDDSHIAPIVEKSHARRRRRLRRPRHRGACYARRRASREDCRLAPCGRSDYLVHCLD